MSYLSIRAFSGTLGIYMNVENRECYLCFFRAILTEATKSCRSGRVWLLHLLRLRPREPRTTLCWWLCRWWGRHRRGRRGQYRCGWWSRCSRRGRRRRRRRFFTEFILQSDLLVCFSLHLLFIFPYILQCHVKPLVDPSKGLSMAQ